jgi:hypothetical protein
VQLAASREWLSSMKLVMKVKLVWARNGGALGPPIHLSVM